MKKLLLGLLAIPMMIFGVATLVPTPAVEAQFNTTNSLTDYTDPGAI